MRPFLWTGAAAALLAMAAAPLPARGATNVAVFNFEMQSETPEWKWLEKGLAVEEMTPFCCSGPAILG